MRSVTPLEMSCTSEAGSTDLAAKFNQNVRPLLNAAQELRKLEVSTKEIPFPSIILIGDEFSGKTSVRELLTGIILPERETNVTEEPLVLSLQSCPAGESWKHGTKSAVDCDSSSPAFLLDIGEPNAPDLTAIEISDVYALAQTVVQGRQWCPSAVVLNILSAKSDFHACGSTRVSREMDKLGERIVTVVTAVDQASNIIYEKVTAMAKSDVGTEDLKYSFLTNRRGDGESNELACKIEKQFFESHPFLSLLDKESVGIPALAERVTTIQAKIIRSHLAVVGKEIDQALIETLNELDDQRKATPGDEDPEVWLRRTLLDNIGKFQDWIQRGDYRVHLVQIFRKFSDGVDGKLLLFLRSSKTQEIMQMIGLGGVGGSGGFSLLDVHCRKIVIEEIDKILNLCISTATDMHSYASLYALDIIRNSTTPSNSVDLQNKYMQIAKDVIGESLKACTGFIHRTFDKERSTVLFTANNIFTTNVSTIQANMDGIRHGRFTKCLHQLTIAGIAGEISCYEMKGKSAQYESAFGLKMNMVAYLSVVFSRMVDGIMLEVEYSLHNTLLRGLSEGALEAMRGESMTHDKQEREAIVEGSTNRLNILKNAKGILKNVL